LDLIAGQFEQPAQPDGVLDATSPADFSESIATVPWAISQVDRAVAAAREAQAGWAARPLEDRVAIVRKIGALCKAHEEELARGIAQEIGKPLWEARTEVAAVVNKAGVTVDEGLAWVRGFVPGQPLGAGLPRGENALECHFRPLGVLAVLGPFNFPVHLANGHILPALATGNAVILKPSEVAPQVAERYARILVEAGVPPGVFNLIQGPGSVGAALVAHPRIDGVLFTGSWAVGQRIEEATRGQAKMLALEMGGKNAALVLDDADEDKALYDVLFSAFVSAGQRCTAASRCIVQGPASRADAFAAKLKKLARGLEIGHPLDAGVFMGPLASLAAAEKFDHGIAAATSADIEVLLQPETRAPRGLAGAYRSPAIHRIHRATGSAFEREELFGPALSIYSADDDQQAVALANATDYGLAASVHTGSAERFSRCLAGLECGLVNQNAPTVGASGRLPFGGLKRSGNHRPAALFSTLYCTAAVAVMRGDRTLDTKKLAPGVRWDG
jgi:succinylglutamic semialdehyde dehydrogenase